MSNRTLIVVDGSAILYRAFHAIPLFTAPDGTPTNAVYGFIKMLLSLSDKFKPEFLSVALDTPKPTFRKKLLPSYQAQRPKAPDELIIQIPLIEKFLKKAQISYYSKAGYEADDVIGSIVKTQNKPGLNTYVITGDKDMLQLVDSRITVVMPIKGVSILNYYDKDKVKEKFGITPDQIIDYKALMGDPSDNYPGVKGIGPKTATGLLERYQTLESVYKNLEQIGGRTSKLLKQHQEDAWLSQELARIRIDLKTGFSFKKSRCQTKKPSPELIEFLKRLGLYSIEKQLIKKSDSSLRSRQSQSSIGQIKSKQVDKNKKNQLSFF